MNIFVLDPDAATAAHMMCDKHIVKMILESCQLLSTAHHVVDGEQIKIESEKRKYTSYSNMEMIRQTLLLSHTYINQKYMM